MTGDGREAKIEIPLLLLADGHGRDGRADEEEDDDGRLDAPMNIQGFPPRQRRRAGGRGSGRGAELPSSSLRRSGALFSRNC